MLWCGNCLSATQQLHMTSSKIRFGARMHKMWVWQKNIHTCILNVESWMMEITLHQHLLLSKLTPVPWGITCNSLWTVHYGLANSLHVLPSTLHPKSPWYHQPPVGHAGKMKPLLNINTFDKSGKTAKEKKPVLCIHLGCNQAHINSTDEDKYMNKPCLVYLGTHAQLQADSLATRQHPSVSS